MVGTFFRPGMRVPSRDALADRLVVVVKLLEWGWSEGAGSCVTGVRSINRTVFPGGVGWTR